MVRPDLCEGVAGQTIETGAIIERRVDGSKVCLRVIEWRQPASVFGYPSPALGIAYSAADWRPQPEMVEIVRLADAQDAQSAALFRAAASASKVAAFTAAGTTGTSSRAMGGMKRLRATAASRWGASDAALRASRDAASA